MSCGSFDRIADRYDETRGGVERGARFTEAIDPLLMPNSAVLEICVGTGAVAQPLAERGHQLWGIDISRAMLERAASRLAGLVEGDVGQLPYRSDSFDAVVAVWAVHVVDRHDRLVVELERVLRAGGRLLMVGPRPEVEPNDMTDLAFSFGRYLGKPDRTVAMADLVESRGWDCVAAPPTAWDHDETTPIDRAASIERRDWSSLWELDDETWARVIQPIVDGLRALPHPERARPLRTRHPVTACTFHE